MRLDDQDFLKLIRFSPLFSIDLVVVNENRELLIGKRVNAPAKGWWFVPGGRVYKNETLRCAFSRITTLEIGESHEMQSCKSLGLYEHFYDESALCEDVSTHYINTPYLIKINKSDVNAPKKQHDSYRWVSLDKVDEDLSIHKYSKVFIPALLLALDMVHYD